MQTLERFWQGCGHCSGEEGCPTLQAARTTYEHNRWFQGGSLVGAAVVIFLLPLTLAVGAGQLCATYLAPAWLTVGAAQAIGVVVGLLLGACVARLIIYATPLVSRARQACAASDAPAAEERV